MTAAQLQAVSETAGTLTAARPGVMRVRIIDEGQGASGSYPAATLEQAAKDRIFHKGLHVHFDHPTATEAAERPERSVLTLAGSLTSDATWNADTHALEADFKPYDSVYDSIRERAGDIGLSIRASAEVDDDGTVARLVEAQSVDLVTRAGRGGKILDVIESARRGIAERNGFAYQPLTEATDNDVRRYLSDAVDAAHDGPHQMVFLEDFDATYVYVRLTRWDDDGTHYRSEFRQTYTRDGVNVTLTGDPEEVRPETIYTPTKPDPTPEPDSSTAAVESRKTTATAGGDMVDVQESELQKLRDTAGRVKELEEARDEEKARADQAEAALVEARAERVHAQAEQIVEAAFAGIDAPKAKARIIESAAPEGFDAEAFKTVAEEAAAEFTGHGPTVTGFGETRPVGEAAHITDEDLEKQVLAISEGGR